MVFQKAWHAVAFVGVVVIGANELIGEGDAPGIVADPATVQNMEDNNQSPGRQGSDSTLADDSSLTADSPAAEGAHANGFDFETWLAEDTQDNQQPDQITQPDDGAEGVVTATSRNVASSGPPTVAENSRNGQRPPGPRKKISAEDSDERLARDLTEALRKKAN